MQSQTANAWCPETNFDATDGPAEGRLRMRRLTTMFLVLLVLSGATACGAEPNRDEAKTPAQGTSAPPATKPSGASLASTSEVPKVLFAERRPGGGDMLAEIRGELVLDERGCLRVRYRGGSSVIVWPTGFEPERADGEVRVLDREGKVVAKVGEAVYMGGGGSPIRGNKAVDDRTRQRLLERCPGSYWIAAPPVRIPRQR